MQISKEVGKRLQSARKAAGLTQTEVARRLGMKQQAYARYEGGIFELDYQKIIMLCRMLGTKPDFLFGFEDEDGFPVAEKSVE